MRVGVGNVGATLTTAGGAKTTGCSTTIAGATETTIGKNGWVPMTGAPSLGTCGNTTVAETLGVATKILGAGRTTTALGVATTMRLRAATASTPPPAETKLGISTSVTTATMKRT